MYADYFSRHHIHIVFILHFHIPHLYNPIAAKSQPDLKASSLTPQASRLSLKAHASSFKPQASRPINNR